MDSSGQNAVGLSFVSQANKNDPRWTEKKRKEKGKQKLFTSESWYSALPQVKLAAFLHRDKEAQVKSKQAPEAT